MFTNILYHIDNQRKAKNTFYHQIYLTIFAAIGINYLTEHFLQFYMLPDHLYQVVLTQIVKNSVFLSHV